MMMTKLPIKFKQSFFIFLVLLLAPYTYAKDLKIGVGNFPPYFDEKGKTGLFNELILEVFKLMPQHHLMTFEPMSNYRLVVELSSGRVDGSANIFANAKINGCRSDPIFRYTDVVVNRKDRKLNIKSIADLKGKRIITYQGAHTFLGKQFQQVSSSNPLNYQEVSHPDDQARQLVMGKFDVSVGDMYIFLDSINSKSDPKYSFESFEFHRIFPDMYSYMAFADKSLCDEFNAALNTIKKNGTYEFIYSQHLKKLGFPR